MAIDESMGSLEEISDNLHQHLNTHIDHASVLQYELDMLRSQLTEKNRLVRVIIIIIIFCSFYNTLFLIDNNSTSYYQTASGCT
jgi:hypothetical protein